ncbi:MAG: ion transporter [Emergencia timonensis]|uniref:ion transporter n=1 Tax=Emergencia timonensis TaxID=1776384 RepID=UPI0009EE16C5|nr:ion transporter [Emergencia timonensis]WNX87809.1 ion transporter [Emergencia timonensis]
MKNLRVKIYDLVSAGGDASVYAKGYDICMVFTIFASLMPLLVKNDTLFLYYVDKICAAIFIIDYVLRFLVADFLLGKHGKKAFFLYPFTPMAIVDLISILPSLVIFMHNGLKIFRLFRLFRTMQVFRVVKLFRYSKNVTILLNVFRNQKDALVFVFGLAMSYVFICALIIFNVEPETFHNFFEAVYWAVISLSTVGYGDIYPVTTMGRVITILSAIVGIAIIALPAGVITAGYMEELSAQKEKDDH